MNRRRGMMGPGRLTAGISLVNGGWGGKRWVRCANRLPYPIAVKQQRCGKQEVVVGAKA